MTDQLTSPRLAVPRPLLRVGIELNSRGHHPALRIEIGDRIESRWFDLAARDEDGVSVVRIRATDLADAQRVRASIRAEVDAEGGDPTTVAVLVDVSVLIAPQARSARSALIRLDGLLRGPRKNDSLEYIGTPTGLAGLIADMYAVGVADGVTVLPLTERTVVEHLVDETLPDLAVRGLVPRTTPSRFPPK